MKQYSTTAILYQYRDTKRAHLMHHHPDIILTKYSFIKSAHLKNHPTVHTLSSTKYLIIQSKLIAQSQCCCCVAHTITFYLKAISQAAK